MDVGVPVARLETGAEHVSSRPRRTGARASPAAEPIPGPRAHQPHRAAPIPAPVAAAPVAAEPGERASAQLAATRLVRRPDGRGSIGAPASGAPGATRRSLDPDAGGLRRGRHGPGRRRPARRRCRARSPTSS